MKSSRLALCLTLALLPIATHAQYSARQLTRKIVPQNQPQPPPSRASTPTPVPANSLPAGDSEKAKAAKSEAQRRAVDYQRKRAEEGSGQAQYDLGVRYLKGDGVEPNDKLGREWLEKSAKSGFSQAQRKLDELPKLKEPSPSVTPAISASAPSLAPATSPSSPTPQAKAPTK